MSVEVEWTNVSVIQLINEYKKHPELWDSTHASFHQATAKYQAWSHLAKLFSCDIADLRKKINSIFASHRREKAKIRYGGKSQWFLYPHLKFLPSHLENTTHSKLQRYNASKDENTWHQLPDPATDDEKDENSNGDSDQHETVVEEITIKEEPLTIAFNHPKRAHHSHQATINKTRYSRPLKKKLIRKSATSQLDNRLLEALKNVRRSRMKDECDSFGEYIADSLRKHDERTQSMIKQAINNILFEQEMKKYSIGQYSVVISDTDISTDTNPLILGDAEVSDPVNVAK